MFTMLKEPGGTLKCAFPSIRDALPFVEYMTKAASRGVATEVYIALDKAIGHSRVDGEIWQLEPLLRMGCKVYLQTDIEQTVIVVDGSAHVLTPMKGEFVSSEREWSFSKLGMLSIKEGVIYEIQSLEREPCDLDMVLYIKAKDDSGRYPVFISSDMVRDRLDIGYTVTVAYLINFAGRGLRSLNAPSELFLEALDLKVTGKTISKEHRVGYKRVRDIVDRLLANGIQISARDVLSESNRKEWEERARNKIFVELRRQGLFVDWNDESYIYNQVRRKADAARAKLESEYVARGLKGRLGLLIEKIKANTIRRQRD